MKIKMTLKKLSEGFQEKDAQLLVILSIVLNSCSVVQSLVCVDMPEQLDFE